MNDIFGQLFRDMANAPRIAREITVKAAKECGVCADCGRDLARGPCPSRSCFLRPRESQAAE